LLAAGGEEQAALPAGDELHSGELSVQAVANADAIRDSEVVFLALHGGAGEDGTIQALLELAGKPYTGSGVLASALAMNKAMSKRVFEQAGIPTPPWTLVPAEGLLAALIRVGDVPPAIQKLGLPLVVKPNEEGSTFGLT